MAGLSVRAQCASCLIPDPGSDPGSLTLQEQLQHFSLCSALKQQLHRARQGSPTLLQHSTHSSHCSQGAAGAATAKPLHEMRETEAGRVINKARDKWSWAGSSLELNPGLPETQQSTTLISLSQCALPAPSMLGCLHQKEPPMAQRQQISCGTSQLALPG